LKLASGKRGLSQIRLRASSPQDETLVCIMLKEVAAIDNLPEVIKVPDWPLEQFFQDSYSANAVICAARVRRPV